MRRNLLSVTARVRGFTLVEVLVALLIGMFGIIVMLQVFALAEGQKRSTSGGSDSISNGSIALFGIERDLQQGGMGFANLNMLGCSLQLRAGVTLSGLAPVTINHASIPAGDANTDTLLVAYGNPNGSTEGDVIDSQPPPSLTYAVKAATSFAANDRVVATPKLRLTPCSLVLDKVDPAHLPSTPNVFVLTNVAGVSGGTLFNLGNSPKVVGYAIRGGSLTTCDYMAADCSSAGSWTIIAPNIVSMRAEYGHDTSSPMNTTVDAYDQTTPTTACGWARTPAVRMVLVARSAQYEKTDITTAAPGWMGAAAIDLSGDAKWKRYRYKVFQTVVPIRNLAWINTSTTSPSCP